MSPVAPVSLRGHDVDPALLRLVRPGNGTPVIGREDYDRTPFELRVKYTFTGSIEVVAIDQGVNRHRKSLIEPRTTPQMAASIVVSPTMELIIGSCSSSTNRN